MEDTQIKRWKDYEDIPDPIGHDANQVIKNIVWISIALVLAEGLKKQDLHMSGVPTFVLDTEPLITMPSYGIVFISVMFGLGIYALFVKFEDTKMKRETVTLLRKIRGPLAVMVFMASFFIQIGPFLTSKKIEEKWLVYISKDFKVIGVGHYSKVVSNDNDRTTLAFCKTTWKKDTCVEESEDIPKDWITKE